MYIRNDCISQHWQNLAPKKFAGLLSGVIATDFPVTLFHLQSNEKVSFFTFSRSTIFMGIARKKKK